MLNDGGNLGAVATFNAVTSYKASSDSNATPFTTIANPFPAGLVGPQGSSLGLAARYGDSLLLSPGQLPGLSVRLLLQTYFCQ